MAGVVVWLIGIAATQAVVHVKNKRSPLIRLPLPPAEDSLAPLSTDFSERDLKRVTRSWRAREQALTARYNAIISARERGLERCWAGDVVQARVIRRARDEAEWVADKLEDAIRWCRQQGVKKGGIKTLALGKMAERARTSYASTPPALYELPFPLPVAPDWNDYHLTVDRLEVTGPPAYRYEPDEQGGEKVVERSEMLAGYSERA